jgi:hypothetical protein
LSSKKEASSLDEGMEKVVAALNKIKGIKTIESHKGDVNEHLSWVSFETRSFESLGRLMKKITISYKGAELNTKITKDSGEVEFGYWVEVGYDKNRSWPVFFIKVLAPKEKTRLVWINNLSRFLSYRTRK